MQSGAMFLFISGVVIATLLSCTQFCTATPTLTLQGCGPDEMGLQSRYRNLCLFYNGLLKQQAYENYKSELPINRFVPDVENSPSDMMIVPAGESHYTNGGVKRQDVDHVFLRFGRRR